jgi:hypothetical protein
MANREGLTIRHAAFIAGLGYLLNPVPFAEFFIYPKLVIGGHIDQTVANISSHPGLFLAGIFCYLINFIGDIVITWALYLLLLPVNGAVSLLAALFRLVYTTAGVVAMFNLVTVYRVLTTPQYLTLFGASQLNAQVDLLLPFIPVRLDFQFGNLFDTSVSRRGACLLFRLHPEDLRTYIGHRRTLFDELRTAALLLAQCELGMAIHPHIR